MRYNKPFISLMSEMVVKVGNRGNNVFTSDRQLCVAVMCAILMSLHLSLKCSCSHV